MEVQEAKFSYAGPQVITDFTGCTMHCLDLEVMSRFMYLKAFSPVSTAGSKLQWSWIHGWTLQIGKDELHWWIGLLSTSQLGQTHSDPTNDSLGLC